MQNIRWQVIDIYYK